MSGKKVLFQVLERLDLVDLRGIQDLAHNYISQMGGGIFGDAKGVLKPPTTITINNTTDLISFSDFTYLANQDDTESTEGNTVDLVSFDAQSSNNGTLSFDDLKTSVQAFYTGNSNTLPPSPTETAFNQNIHGQYYPYIFARRLDYEGTQDNRRFWSVSNGNEISQNVNTRSEFGCDFLLANTLTSPPSVTGSQWTPIGRIFNWTVSTNVVSLGSALVDGVKIYSVLDDVITFEGNELISNVSTLPNTYASLIQNGALKGFGRILKQMLKFVNVDGSDDANTPATVTARSYFTQPKYSLNAVAPFLDFLNVNKERRQYKHSSIVVISNVNQGVTPTITKTEWTPNGVGQTDTSNNWFSTSVGFDYNILGITSFVNAGATAPYDATDIYLSTDTRNAFLSHFYISIPSTYQNYGMKINVSPFYEFQEVDKVYKKDNTYQCYPMVNWDLANGQDSEMLRVNQLENLVDSQGNSVSNLYGFRVGVGGLYDRDGSSAGYYTNTLNQLQKDIRIKLEITLFETN